PGAGGDRRRRGAAGLRGGRAVRPHRGGADRDQSHLRTPPRVEPGRLTDPIATILAMSDHGRSAALSLMESAGVAAPAIAVFLDAYDRVAAGETGLVAEADLEPV